MKDHVILGFHGVLLPDTYAPLPIHCYTCMSDLLGLVKYDTSVQDIISEGIYAHTHGAAVRVTQAS